MSPCRQPRPEIHIYLSLQDLGHQAGNLGPKQFLAETFSELHSCVFLCSTIECSQDGLVVVPFLPRFPTVSSPIRCPKYPYFPLHLTSAFAYVLFVPPAHQPLLIFGNPQIPLVASHNTPYCNTVSQMPLVPLSCLLPFCSPPPRPHHHFSFFWNSPDTPGAHGDDVRHRHGRGLSPELGGGVRFRGHPGRIPAS